MKDETSTLVLISFNLEGSEFVQISTLKRNRICEMFSKGACFLH